MDNINLENLKEMLNKGELNDVISQIPPEMIQNFSAMMNNNTSQSKNSNNGNNNDNSNVNTNTNNTNFDFSKIDMNTILKMKSVMEKLNNSNDSRSNLLYSLKPYLRESKKEKLDQYANLLNIAKIAVVLKNDNKENH